MKTPSLFRSKGVDAQFDYFQIVIIQLVYYTHNYISNNTLHKTQVHFFHKVSLFLTLRCHLPLSYSFFDHRHSTGK